MNFSCVSESIRALIWVLLKSNFSLVSICRVFSFESFADLIVVNTKTSNSQLKDLSFFLEHLEIMCSVSLQLKQQFSRRCFSQSWDSSFEILFRDWEECCSSTLRLSSMIEKISIFERCRLSEIRCLFNDFWSSDCRIVVLSFFLSRQIFSIFFMRCSIVIMSWIFFEIDLTLIIAFWALDLSLT